MLATLLANWYDLQRGICNHEGMRSGMSGLACELVTCSGHAGYGKLVKGKLHVDQGLPECWIQSGFDQ